jgi:outer membrane protein
MRPRAIIVTALALFSPFSVAFAAGNVASVDYQRLVHEAPQAQASDKLLKKQYAPQEQAIKRERGHVADLRKSYAGLGRGANALERANAGENLKAAQKKLANMEQQYSQGLALRSHQLRTNFKSVVKADIRAYAKAHGFSVVLNDGVAYAGASRDITDAILAILKSDYRKVQAAAHKKDKSKKHP